MEDYLAMVTRDNKLFSSTTVPISYQFLLVFETLPPPHSHSSMSDVSLLVEPRQEKESRLRSWWRFFQSVLLGKSPRFQRLPEEYILKIEIEKEMKKHEIFLAEVSEKDADRSMLDGSVREYFVCQASDMRDITQKIARSSELEYENRLTRTS